MLIEPLEHPATVPDVADSKPWEAELDLTFARSGRRTLLAQRRHRGPLTVQRPFYPEGSMCHVYLLHPPGGIVAGDRLRITARVGSGAEALLTTPAAGKFYRSEGTSAQQTVSLGVEAGGVLEWLPQETIVFEGARLTSTVNVDLDADARFFGWEILALGRPAAGESFTSGEALLHWRIHRNGKPLYLERMRLDAEAVSARWGLNGYSSCGTLFACPATSVQLEAVRATIGETTGRGVTLIDDLLICRAVGTQTRNVRDFFESVRAVLRREIVQREPYQPRIWST